MEKIQQTPKRPREDTNMSLSPINTEPSEIDMLIGECEKIDKPTFADFWSFLLKFSKSSANLAAKVSNLETKISSVEDQQEVTDGRLDDAEGRLSVIESTQRTFETTASEKIEKLEVALAELSNATYSNTVSTNYLLQKNLDNDIFLKGFLTEPDPKVVVQSLMNVFGVDLSTVSSYHYVNYTTRPATGYTNGKPLHFVAITFKTKDAKIEFFKAKKSYQDNKGSVMWSQLETSNDHPDASSTTIKITNKLSKFNLFIQKTLYRLHAQKIIQEYRYHNCLFQFKPNEQSDWIRIETYNKLKAFVRS